VTGVRKAVGLIVEIAGLPKEAVSLPLVVVEIF
jgi:hypothetical protein